MCGGKEKADKLTASSAASAAGFSDSDVGSATLPCGASKADAEAFERAEALKQQAQELLTDEVNDLPKKNKPAIGIGAVDPETGDIVVAFCGPIPADDEISPKLKAAADKIGGVRTKTVCGNTIGACAEFRAANQLLTANPNLNISDIVFTDAIRPRNGTKQARCDNCIAIFGAE